MFDEIEQTFSFFGHPYSNRSQNYFLAYSYLFEANTTTVSLLYKNIVNYLRVLAGPRVASHFCGKAPQSPFLNRVIGVFYD